MSDDRAGQFLSLIRRAQRGRHKVYLGYGPGVGKTSLMLQEGHRLKADGIDAVVGVVETHGRIGTAKLVDGLEVVPRRISKYHGIEIGEMDVDALLVRHPQVALIDELAHANVPGSRNEKRYQDVQELLAAGIHVISTLNIQHLESLYDTVERQIGVKVRERIPDAVLVEADQVVNVDLAPEDLHKRLALGQIYPNERVPAAMENYFKAANLEQLRELTLRELAAQIDFRRRDIAVENDAGAADQVMVCLSSRGPNSIRLLRFASRLAGRLNRTWYAVYVQTAHEDPLSIDATTQRLLAQTLTLANQLGAMVFTFTGEDVTATILRFAKEYRVGHVVIGKPRPFPWWKRLLGKRSIAERLIFAAKGLTVVMVDVQEPAEMVTHAALPTPAGILQPPSPSKPATIPPVMISDLLTPALIRIWTSGMTRTETLHILVEAIGSKDPAFDQQDALSRLEMRERQGSTFLTGTVALPHAVLPGLKAPRIALGLARAGVSGVEGGAHVRVVFLLLSPSGQASMHLHMLAAASRLFQNRELWRLLEEAEDPSQVQHAIASIEHRGRSS